MRSDAIQIEALEAYIKQLQGTLVQRGQQIINLEKKVLQLKADAPMSIDLSEPYKREK